MFYPSYFLQQAPLLQSPPPPPPHPAYFLLELQKPASSALNHNNYPKNCTAESVRGEGNEAQRHHRLPPLSISHVCAALKEDASAWDGAICSRHEDGEKGSRCDCGTQKASVISEGPGGSCGGWQHKNAAAVHSAGPASPGAQIYRTLKVFFICESYKPSSVMKRSRQDL